MANTTKGRVIIPRNPKELLDLATKIFKKHQSDGKDSELRNLDDYDWDRVGPTITKAFDYHKQAEDLKGQMEAMYRKRDALVAPVAEITKASSGYLKGKYQKNPKRLTDWGYAVDDTPKAKKAAKSKKGE